MNREKAFKILKEKKISVTKKGSIISSNKDSIKNRKTLKAISSAYTGGGYYHPQHFNNFNGSKDSSYMSNGKIKRHDLKRLQNRCYEILHDSPNAQVLMRSFKNLVINKGLRVQSTPVTNILNYEEKDITRISNKLESLFKMWSESRESDFLRNDNYKKLEIQRAEHLFLYGEYFYLRVFNSKNKINPLSIQIIDPRNVCNPAYNIVNKIRKSGGDILDGIEVDKKGEKIAIYVKIKKKDETDYKRIPFVNSSGYRHLAHGTISHPDLNVTKRGLPLLSLVVHELEKIADADLFELDTMAVNASIAGFVSADDGAVGNEDVMGEVGTDIMFDMDDTSTVAYSGNKWDMRHRNISKGGIWLQNLPSGHSIKEFETKRPNANFQTYFEKKMEIIAPATTGFSLELVKIMFGQNFSASRASNDLSFKAVEVFRQIFVLDNREDYEQLVSGFVAMGMVAIPNYSDAMTRIAISSSEWYGVEMPVFNPVQEASGRKIDLEQGLLTREEASQIVSGKSYEANISRLAEENKLLAIANEPLNESEETNDE